MEDRVRLIFDIYIRYTIAIFYTEHVSHHFDLLGESRKKTC